MSVFISSIFLEHIISKKQQTPNPEAQEPLKLSYPIKVLNEYKKHILYVFDILGQRQILGLTKGTRKNKVLFFSGPATKALPPHPPLISRATKKITLLFIKKKILTKDN